jgi:hypothetical protein
MKVEVIADGEGMRRVGGRPMVDGDGPPIFDPLPRRGVVCRSFGRRVGRDPLTNHIMALPRRDLTLVHDIAEIPLEVEGLASQKVMMSGDGPPLVPLVELDELYIGP